MNADSIRWAALRALLLDVLADAPERKPPPPQLVAKITVLIRNGASVRDVSVALSMERDEVVAILARMAH